MRTAHLPTVYALVVATKCKYWAGGTLYNEVRCIMGNGLMGILLSLPGQNDRR